MQVWRPDVLIHHQIVTFVYFKFDCLSFVKKRPVFWKEEEALKRSVSSEQQFYRNFFEENYIFFTKWLQLLKQVTNC
jgi:hypothetical protein